MSCPSMVRRVTGAAASLALALGIGLGAAPAQAATTTATVWDKVASCESGGRWSINTHNGYYGGLQFAPRTWSGHGGKAYASFANKAGKAEQIAVARRVLASQGAGAWGGCARKAGLTKTNGGADKQAVPSTNPGAEPATPVLDPTAPDNPYSSPRPTPTSAVNQTVRVEVGDTLSKIAERNDVVGGWRGLWELNKKTLKEPNKIYVGQVLKIN